MTYRNLLLVFLLVGLWHGAAWTFVLWGLYNGGLLVVERRTGIRQLSDDRAVVARRVTTFLLVVLGWVLFEPRASETQSIYIGPCSRLTSKRYQTVCTRP